MNVFHGPNICQATYLLNPAHRLEFIRQGPNIHAPCFYSLRFCQRNPYPGKKSNNWNDYIDLYTKAISHGSTLYQGEQCSTDEADVTNDIKSCPEFVRDHIRLR